MISKYFAAVLVLIITEQLCTRTQGAYMSQRDHMTTASVSFGQDITGEVHSALNLIGLSSTTVM